MQVVFSFFKSRFTPFLKWFPLLKNKEVILADMMAGLTGAFIVLPQGIAFATIAGLPPQYGLYTAMVTPVIAALFGSSFHLISGPTTAISLVVFSTISSHAELGSPEFIELALILTFLAGVYQLVFGLVRLGKVVDFVSHTVVTGFTAGAAILIITSQVKYVLGISIPSGSHFLETWKEVFLHLGSSNIYAVMVGIGTLLVSFTLKKLFPKFPNLLVALIFGGVFAFLIQGQSHGLNFVAQIPSSLPTFHLLNFSFDTFKGLASGAFAVALLGLIEAISISRSVASKSHQRIDANQEFVGQGLSNVIGSFFSCYAGSGSFTRSGVNYAAGARTPMSAVFAAIFLAIIVLLIAPVTQYLPIAAMGGVIILVGYGLIHFSEIRKILTSNASEASVFLVTFLSTLFLELEFAIYLGIFLSLVLFLNRTSTPDIVSYVRNYNRDKKKFEFVSAHKIEPSKVGTLKCPQMEIIRIDMSVYFGSVNHIQSKIHEITERGVYHILVIAKSINFIDMSGMEMLEKENERLGKLAGGLYFVGLKTKVLVELSRGGFIAQIGKEHIFDHLSEAIPYIYMHKLSMSRCQGCTNKIFLECSEYTDEPTDYRMGIISAPTSSLFAKVFSELKGYFSKKVLKKGGE